MLYAYGSCIGGEYMFIVSFFGGLGSQMEQYAFYKALKHHYPTASVKMDNFHIIRAGMHNGYELDYVFGIDKNEATLEQIQALSDKVPYGVKRRAFYELANRVRRNIIGPKESWILAEDPSEYMKEIFELSPLKSYIFVGNWSYLYWEDIIDEVLDDFKFIHPLEGMKLEISKRIESSNAVSVHVRRGDYISTGLPTLSSDYYRKCFSIIESKVENPVYYFFSDDMDYVKQEYVDIENKVFVEGNTGINAYVDMQLMSLCKHNIIANSTYSRWGASLNRNKNKIVISPRRHVEGLKKPFGHTDWILIDN